MKRIKQLQYAPEQALKGARKRFMPGRGGLKGSNQPFNYAICPLKPLRDQFKGSTWPFKGSKAPFNPAGNWFQLLLQGFLPCVWPHQTSDI